MKKQNQQQLEIRLNRWRREKLTNENGMAAYADDAILQLERLIDDAILQLERSIKEYQDERKRH
jgi:hypothetical protein